MDQPLGLAADVDIIFILAVDEGHGVVVGLDDGKGGLHLVAGVGDKLLLLFHACQHRADCLL